LTQAICSQGKEINMSLKPRHFPGLPEDTARVARAAFRKGSIYLTIGDEIGHIFRDADFEDLYALNGAPGLSPAQLVLVLIFQSLENLSDRQAADAVRGRIEWKYALHLGLANPGFDFSVLSEFRDRLVKHEAGPRVLDRVLERMAGLGLLKEGGRQRTDSTYVLSAARAMNRLELVMETMRLALEETAAAAPDWLRAVALPHWVERYTLVWRGSRMPKSKAKVADLAASVGEDGAYLLQAAEGEGAPEVLADIEALQLLRDVWKQQYEQGPDGWVWRSQGTLPPNAELIETPHDREARYSNRRGKAWQGYRVHFTETCDPDQPRLITHVEVTPATQPDIAAVEPIHQELKRRGYLPQKHLMDAGYVAAHTMVESQKDYGVDVIGPVNRNTTWQAKEEGGFIPETFEINWQRQEAICPEGQVSCGWSESQNEFGQPVVHIRFPTACCHICPSRSRCTRSKTGRSLKLSPYFPAIVDARSRQETKEFRKEYAQRAGVEGTISEAVRKHGARRSHYVGQKKTQLHEILLATAINLERAARWLMGYRLASTRTSRFATLMAAA
jgi:transposase